ncbi:MAG: hypothetical protein JSV09_05510 [Thermoplasmata archaeon]|nr:MAG: hypothetical protein JSV09_05510 [Thermoplasmata archaeon]
MESKTTGSRFFVSRAIEEPLEATVELGEDIQKIGKKALLPLNLGILAFIILALLLIPSTYDLLSYIRRGLLGDVEFTNQLLLNATISGLLIVLLFAIIITSLLYLSQINKFNSINLLRCCNISDLTQVKPQKKEKPDAGKIRGKHLANPIFAVMDLEEESMHVLPQIIKMLRYCVFFIGLSMVILILNYAFIIGLDYNLLFSFGIIRMGIGIIVIGKFLIVLKLLMDTESDFRYIHTRHSIIDSVRFQKDIRVPKGENQLSRLIIYLKENDPYIRSSVVAEKKEFSESVKLKGKSGKEHEFDAYFPGTNILKDKSVALGMPMGRFGVFIRVFRDEITLAKLKMLRDSAMDVCKKENMFPLRIIALLWKVSDIPDDVYEDVLENAIKMKNILTHLEIVAEDGEVYSFIPMISYGEKLG